VYRYRSARYDIAVDNPDGVSRGVVAIGVDGTMLAATGKVLIPLVDDGAVHLVRVVLGACV
jgi:cyclic beta-1,2-glucan synthetase